jgi:hypothetical protein
MLIKEIKKLILFKTSVLLQLTKLIKKVGNFFFVNSI